MLIKEDSLKKRYFSKLLTNFVGLFVSLVTQALIPRGLGPKAYGDFNFLSQFFTEVIKFLDMGTSLCFYTKLSKRPSDVGLVSFYMRFSFIVCFIMFLFVFGAQFTNARKLLWPNQEHIYIYFAAGWASLLWFSRVLNTMTDAYGITFYSEIIKILQRLLGLLLVIILYVFEKFNLLNFFYYQYIILLFLCIIFVLLLNLKKLSPFQNYKLSHNQIKSYTKEFYIFSHPLFASSLIGMLVGVFDRWSLQFFSGSVEQGFFGFSFQIGAVCFVFTTAMTQLLLREFSIAFGTKDIPKMTKLFRRYIPTLYSIAAYLACFTAIQANAVTYIFGGEKFAQAAWAVAIMAFYPIHMTYGQLSGSVFMATGETRLFRNISIIFMLLGLPATYFLIAPADKLGLNAGAVGLAIKMVIFQFLIVNVQLYYNSRFLKLQFRNYLIHQIMSIFLMTFLAYLSNFVIKKIGFELNIIIGFVASGILYTILVCVVSIFFPPLFGLHKNDIQNIVKSFIKLFK